MQKRIVWFVVVCVVGVGTSGGVGLWAQETPGRAEPADPPAPAVQAKKEPPQSDESRLLTELRAALENNAREIKALREQYARDMAEQKRTVAEYRKQIETLERRSRQLEEQQKTAVGPAALPPGEGDKQKKLTEIQQKQLDLLEQQLGLVGDEVASQTTTIN